MAGGMAFTLFLSIRQVRRAAVAALLGLVFAMPWAHAEQYFDPLKACQDVTEANRNSAGLPNTARALRDRKRIKVLAVGTTPLSQHEQEQGIYGLVENYLETAFKGLDVEIVDRGVSGELARDAFPRIKNEVAISAPDVVFWQVGVADGIARTPPDELKDTLAKTITWLKAHNVDVVLIGMRYVRSLAKDPHYRQIRQVIRDTQRQFNILRIGHYEAVEALDRIRGAATRARSESDLTDVGSLCAADFISRALAAKLFVKPAARGPRPGASDSQAPVAPNAGSPAVPPPANK
ncbi:MAG: hypothetical protein R3D67_03530 [Hyphomicrobiaceae bacterium]